jgi:hypothetical protein
VKNSLRTQGDTIAAALLEEKEILEEAKMCIISF